MNKIVVYEDFNFKGRSKEFTSDVPNLIPEGFNDKISSVKVYGKPWLAFHDCFFKGEEYIFEEGDYARVPVNDAISSLKLAKGDGASRAKQAIPDAMNKIVVYEDFNFQGRSKEFTSDVQNLIPEGFNDIISSVKVYGRPWLAFHDCFFKGEEYIFEEGEYERVPVNDVISSLKLVNDEFLSNPQIVMYKHPDYQGQSVTLTAETDLSDSMSSHKVLSGIWVLYERGNRRGAQMVTKAGQNVPRYPRLNNQVSHVRPVLPSTANESSDFGGSVTVEHQYVFTVR